MAWGSRAAERNVPSLAEALFPPVTTCLPVSVPVPISYQAVIHIHFTDSTLTRQYQRNIKDKGELYKRKN